MAQSSCCLYIKSAKTTTTMAQYLVHTKLFEPAATIARVTNDVNWHFDAFTGGDSINHDE